MVTRIEIAIRPELPDPRGADIARKVRSFLETVGLESACVDLADATPESLVAAVARARALPGELLRRRCRRPRRT